MLKESNNDSSPTRRTGSNCSAINNYASINQTLGGIISTLEGDAKDNSEDMDIPEDIQEISKGIGLMLFALHELSGNCDKLHKKGGLCYIITHSLLTIYRDIWYRYGMDLEDEAVKCLTEEGLLGELKQIEETRTSSAESRILAIMDAMEIVNHSNRFINQRLSPYIELSAKKTYHLITPVVIAAKRMQKTPGKEKLYNILENRFLLSEEMTPQECIEKAGVGKSKYYELESTAISELSIYLWGIGGEFLSKDFVDYVTENTGIEFPL